MAYSVIMPKTGMAMEEGTIIQWFCKEGDSVKEGDAIAEIETDKSTMEVEAEQDGTILKILYGDGETVPVTVTIAWIGEEGEEIPDEADSGAASSAAAPEREGTPETGGEAAGSALDSGTGPIMPPPGKPAAAGAVRATPAARSAAEELKVPLSQVPPGGRYGEVKQADVRDWHHRHKMTPLAARMAADRGLDRSSAPAGSGGRVFSGDLDSGQTGSASSAAPPAAPAAGLREDSRVPLTNIQKITGRRMLESCREIPSVTTDIRADVTRLLELRTELNAESGHRYSINDFVLKAVALSLVDHPRMNSSLDGGELIYHGRVNLGMAVATERGLTVPVISDADLRSLENLSRAAAFMAEKGRLGKLEPDDMSGSTFTISNIGMYGVTGFTPIINPPEAAILGVCGIEDQPAVSDGSLVVRKMMGLSLTFDHRIVDGAESCEFLVGLKGYLEKPLELMVRGG